MTKKELLELAAQHNVAVNPKAKNADIEAALVAANVELPEPTQASQSASDEPTGPIYHVSLPKGWNYPQRQRAGVVVLAGEDGYTGPLTDAQLAEIKADPALTVTPVEG